MLRANTLKTSVMMIPPKGKMDPALLKIGDSSILPCSTMKLLGITLQANLGWTDNVAGLVTISALLAVFVVNTVLDGAIEDELGIRLRGGPEICQTPNCVMAAQELIQNMDLTLDPCEDFYAYSCSGFQKRLMIPDDRSSVSETSLLADQVQYELRQIFDETLPLESSRGAKIPLAFFQACMDSKEVENLGLQPLRDFLKIPGGWPLGPKMRTKKGTSTTWVQLAHKLMDVGFTGNYLFGLDVGTDFKNTTNNIFFLAQPRLGLEYKELKEGWKNKMVQAYYNYTYDMAVLLGEPKTTDLKSTLTKMIQFEINLANATRSWADVSDVDSLYNLMTLGELTQKYPFLSWVQYVNQVGRSKSEVAQMYSLFQIQSNQEVVVLDPEYFERLTMTLKSTPDTTIQSYIIWRAIKTSVPYMNSQVRAVASQFYRQFSGTRSDSPRWKGCLTATSNFFPLLVGKFYVESHFPPEAKDKVSEMVALVTEAFRIRLIQGKSYAAAAKKGFLVKVGTGDIGDPLPPSIGKDLAKLFVTWSFDLAIRGEAVPCANSWYFAGQHGRILCPTLEDAKKVKKLVTGQSVGDVLLTAWLRSEELGLLLTATIPPSVSWVGVDQLKKAIVIQNGLSGWISDLHVRPHPHSKDYKLLTGMLDWMDKETASRALIKLNSINELIGYDDVILNTTAMDYLYRDLDLHPKQFFQNALSRSKWWLKDSWNQLNQSTSEDPWPEFDQAAIVNAFYSPLSNSINLPAGILQGKFYNENRPNYLNYGSIGYIIGHELTHGFDDSGKQFDEEGNLKNWWENKTNEEFRFKADCFVDQYSNFTVPELNLTIEGKHIQGEGIADNGGIMHAYDAYSAWVEKHGEESILPGLDLTSKQLFWASAANTWCTESNTENIKYNVKYGVHPLAKYRVNVPFSNSREFAKDFKCPLGSPMNPELKCKI
eukprot:maker-scaffold75_size407189-snap-gene-3.15 protein:Tk10137 transcript:maker-scaffold75_size407189-snap-gene-3.15-mRNA-1 annotation:"neprilysin-2-like isoform x3"